MKRNEEKRKKKEEEKKEIASHFAPDDQTLPEAFRLVLILSVPTLHLSHLPYLLYPIHTKAFLIFLLSYLWFVSLFSSSPVLNSTLCIIIISILLYFPKDFNASST